MRPLIQSPVPIKPPPHPCLSRGRSAHLPGVAGNEEWSRYRPQEELAVPRPDRRRATDRPSNPDPRVAEPSFVGSSRVPIVVPPPGVIASGSDRTPSSRGRRTRRPGRPSSGARFRPQVGLLEPRQLLATLYASGWDDGGGPSHIYKVEDYASSPRAVNIGSSGFQLNDLAIDPLNDAAYAISLAASSLYSVNLTTGQATRIGSLVHRAWMP